MLLEVNRSTLAAEATEAEAAARAAPPVDSPSLPEAVMMVDRNITLEPRVPSRDVSIEANTGGALSSRQPMTAPAPGTPMSVDPSTGAADHLAGDDKRARMVAGLLLSFEKSTEDWQYASGLGTLVETQTQHPRCAEHATVQPR